MDSGHQLLQKALTFVPRRHDADSVLTAILRHFSTAPGSFVNHEICFFAKNRLILDLASNDRSPLESYACAYSPEFTGNGTQAYIALFIKCEQSGKTDILSLLNSSLRVPASKTCLVVMITHSMYFGELRTHHHCRILTISPFKIISRLSLYNNLLDISPSINSSRSTYINTTTHCTIIKRLIISRPEA